MTQASVTGPTVQDSPPHTHLAFHLNSNEFEILLPFCPGGKQWDHVIVEASGHSPHHNVHLVKRNSRHTLTTSFKRSDEIVGPVVNCSCNV